MVKKIFIVVKVGTCFSKVRDQTDFSHRICIFREKKITWRKSVTTFMKINDRLKYEILIFKKVMALF